MKCPKCNDEKWIREVIVITKADVEKLFGKPIKTLFGTHVRHTRYKIVQDRPCSCGGSFV